MFIITIRDLPCCCNNITGASCAAGDLSMNSKCYRKFFFRGQIPWYDASNDCLSRGGSLAVFTDTGRPSDNRQLTDWLDTSGRGPTYWIGLIRSWWNTTTEGWCKLLCWWCTADMVCSGSGGSRILSRECITYLLFLPLFSCRKTTTNAMVSYHWRWIQPSPWEGNGRLILRCGLCDQKKLMNLANRRKPMTRTHERFDTV